jgi:hypothetical protein
LYSGLQDAYEIEEIAFATMAGDVIGFELDLIAIFLPILESTAEMIFAMIWQVAPYAIGLMVSYLLVLLLMHIFQQVIGGVQVTGAFIGADEEDTIIGGDKDSGFWADDMDGKRTWCPITDTEPYNNYHEQFSDEEKMW